jgi:hypothetical protein
MRVPAPLGRVICSVSLQLFEDSLRLAITKGKAAHVRELVRPMALQGDECLLLQALNE